MPKIQLVFVLIVQQDRATRKDKEKITVFYFLLKIPLFLHGTQSLQGSKIKSQFCAYKNCAYF